MMHKYCTSTGIYIPAPVGLQYYKYFICLYSVYHSLTVKVMGILLVLDSYLSPVHVYTAISVPVPVQYRY